MTKTVTFQNKSKKFTITTKESFLEKCPDPSKYTMLELNSEFGMITFLHNENGPAVVRPDKNIELFWIDGRCIDVENPELAKRMRHKLSFNTVFDEFVNLPTDSDTPTGGDAA